MNRFLLISNLFLLSILGYLSFRLNYFQKAFSYVFDEKQSLSRDCLVNLDYFDFHFQRQPISPEIVLIGDSMIRRGKWAELLGNSSVFNRGIAGDNTDCICKRLKFLKGLKAKVWFLQGGINGIGSTSAQQILLNYQDMVNFVKGEKAEAIIILLLHVSPNAGRSYPHLADFNSINAKVDEINRELIEYAELNELKYLDLNKNFSKNGRLIDAFSDDGLHLNEDAYKIWGAEMKKTLEAFQNIQIERRY